MMFAHDTEVALGSAAALVNTAVDATEALPDVPALDSFVREQGWTGSRRHDESELRAVRALRPRLRRVWYADADGAVEIVNTLLREARALPQLVRHDEWDYHFHATDAGAPLASRMAVEASMALADVIRAGELDRLLVCAADDCDRVLVDLSKNRSRRFCDGGCGNRVAAAAYRARKAASGQTGPCGGPGKPAARGG